MQMIHAYGIKRTGLLAALGVSAFALTGCLGPTYGTDKPASEQFFEDIGNSIKLSTGKRSEPIAYNPRPDLVKPQDTSTLPPPQEDIEKTSGQWPESQEQRLARVRAEADQGKYVPGLGRRHDLGGQAAAGAAATGSVQAGQRVYLTDPPDEFREPAESAPYGDLGVRESVKERQRKRAAKGDEKTGWRKLVPWL